MDPVVIGIAAKPRRQLRYLAQAELWTIPGLGWFLNGMRQIPIRRGTGDSRALDSAVEALRNADAVAGTRLWHSRCLTTRDRDPGLTDSSPGGSRRTP